MKNLAPFFSNFGVYHDASGYCDCIEAFANQEVSMLRAFLFRIIDINNDKKLSESDIFSLMKHC